MIVTEEKSSRKCGINRRLLVLYCKLNVIFLVDTKEDLGVLNEMLQAKGSRIYIIYSCKGFKDEVICFQYESNERYLYTLHPAKQAHKSKSRL